MRKYLAKKAILSFRPQMGNQGSLGTRSQWQRRFGQRGQGGSSSSRDPNAMDVDAITTRNPLSEEEKKWLMAEGRCFFCKQQGHMSRNCPKKPSRQNAAPASPQPCHAFFCLLYDMTGLDSCLRILTISRLCEPMTKHDIAAPDDS
jgi:Zinc knuckle